MRKRVLKSVAAMGYGKFVGAAIQLALVPALATKWGLPLYGQWLMLSSIPLFLAASDFGFSTAAGNRVIEEVARGDRDQALVTFQSAWIMVLAISSVMLIAALAACLLVPGSLLAVVDAMDANEARLVLAIMILYGLVSLQWFLFAAVCRSMGKQALSISLIATSQLVEGLAVLAVALVGGTPFEAAIAYLIVRSVGVVAHVAIAKRFAPWLSLGAHQATRNRVRELIRPALAAMVLPLAQAGYLQGTAVAVGAAGGAAMVPLFTSLRTVSRIGLQLMATLTIPLMPEFTAAWAQGNDRRISLIGGVVTMVNGAFAIAFGMVIWLFGLPLLHLWTNGMIQPPQVMVTLTAMALALSIVWNPLSNLLLAINKHETYSYVYVLAAVATIWLSYLFVGMVGVTGAAAANLLLEVVMVVTVFFSLRRNVTKFDMSFDAIIAVIPERWRGRLSRH